MNTKELFGLNSESSKTSLESDEPNLKRYSTFVKREKRSRSLPRGSPVRSKRSKSGHCNFNVKSSKEERRCPFQPEAEDRVSSSSSSECDRDFSDCSLDELENDSTESGEIIDEDDDNNEEGQPQWPYSDPSDESCDGTEGNSETRSTDDTKVEEKKDLIKVERSPSPEPVAAEDGCRSFPMGCKIDPQTVSDPLRVFQILDEVNQDENEFYASNENSSESESDLSDTEIEEMLEQPVIGVDYGNKPWTFKTKESYKERKLLKLIELGQNHFDLLPEGWIQVFHRSGMPVYLHRASRVCTMSRPYYLGPGSVKKHNIPLMSVPCLSYTKALEAEKVIKEKISVEKSSEPAKLLTARMETAEDSESSQSIKPFHLHQYCKKLFRFKVENKVSFSNWRARRKYHKAKKIEKCTQKSSLPDGTKLIKFPLLNPEDGDSKVEGEWILNPDGKSYICILHEYVQHALKKQPTYEFKALENPATPYSATVLINGMKYGTGTGTSKKQAKLAAAKSSLEVLIPDIRDKMVKPEKASGSTVDDDKISIFDEIKIEDPRVPEFCAKATEPSPYSILLNCLQRNFGLKSTPIDCKTRPINRQSNEFTMSVGKHTVVVICKNKKDGKQKASQKLLQILHPHVTNWGSLLRLYGNASQQCAKEKKQEEHEVTVLQNKASVNSPNYAILNKLKDEMLKLGKAARERIPVGIFIPPDQYSLPRSGADLNKVNI